MSFLCRRKLMNEQEMFQTITIFTSIGIIYNNNINLTQLNLTSVQAGQNVERQSKNRSIIKYIKVGGVMPLYGQACNPSTKHLSWMIPEAKPVHATTR